ncbi:DUF748 domain-containing protein [Marinobacter xestospongiae]|uniref:DUF748 domain-containing protein n=1 Tax=Marinobacter xestospongiae TaxID=994319 RepID=A0ABU3W3N5_9GAMM|nr:DUF748 domain-containing protein [Marinobacter xestospongiae]MDV2080601.1 DUF748 domain-containing protein [Marinobacter xestospongiae]
MARQVSGNRTIKRIGLWLAVVLLLYILAGFVALPWWLERQVPGQFRDQMGWQAEVEDIRFNPFTLALEASALSATDSRGESVLTVPELRVDLSFLHLFTGVLAFDGIRVTQPQLRLELLPGGQVNLLQDWQDQHPATDDPEPESDTESEPIPLLLRSLVLAEGQIALWDRRTDTPRHFDVAPLNLNLSDLATFPRDDGDSRYHLQARIGDQHLSWEGGLSLAPLYSEGRLTLDDLDYDTLAHFAGAALPYTLTDGEVSVSTDYQLAYDNRLSLVTTGGAVTMSELAVRQPAGEDTGLALERLTLTDIRFSLLERWLELGPMTLQNLSLGLARDADGQLNWLKPLVATDPAANDTPEDDSDSAPAWQWSLAGINLTGANLRWQDQLPPRPVSLEATDLSLTLGPVSEQLAEPVDYRLETAVASGGQLSAQGQVTLTPLTLEAAVSARDLALAPLSPYIEQASQLAIRDGRLALDGELDLDDQKQPMTGTFSGSAEIGGLVTAVVDREEELLAWQLLRLAPIEYNLAPARLEIGQVTLTGPQAQLLREASGKLNIAALLASPADATDAPADPDTPTGSGGHDEAPGLIFRIGELALSGGQVAYTDRSVSPAFNTRLRALDGQVIGLSNIPPQQGRVQLSGRVGESGQLRLDGTLSPLGAAGDSTLTLELSDVSMPTFSPYAGRYLGYGIDRGKLGLGLEYQLSGTELSAENRVLLDRLELGQAVASDEAVQAPVSLGLALLRDRRGVIELDIPVSGNLDDPDFRLDRVLWRTFVNLLVKAAASPFSALGAVAEMAGLSGEELGAVDFVPGDVALADGEADKLAVLAQALAERPELILEVRGAVVPSRDGLALHRQALWQQLGVAEAGASTRIGALEGAVRDRFGAATLDAMREQAAAAGGEPWADRLVRRLTADRSLPPETLGRLAAARGEWLHRQLSEQYHIPASQLFLAEPSLDAPASDDGRVTVPFSLQAR